MLDDMTALIIRGIFLLFGLIILYKAINQFVDVGAVVDAGVNAAKTALPLVAAV